MKSLFDRAGHATTLQQQRDYMFSATLLLVIELFLYSLRLLHLDTKTLNFFEFILVPKALLRCRVVATLYNCRVPSSVIYYTVYLQMLNTVAKKKTARNMWQSAY